MQYIQTREDPVVIGCGDLYAIEADDFDMAEFNQSGYDVSQLVNLGYLKDGLSIDTQFEYLNISAANRGIVANGVKDSTTTVDTNIISYKPENVARFLTGYTRVSDANGVTTYAGRRKQHPRVALVFVNTDPDKDVTEIYVFPDAQFVGDYKLEFNSDNPIAWNFKFQCNNVTLPNGEQGAYYWHKSNESEQEDNSSGGSETPTQGN